MGYDEGSNEHVSAETSRTIERSTKLHYAAEYLKAILADGPMPASMVHDHFLGEKVSDRTIISAKKLLCIQSIKKDNAWYWKLPDSNGEQDC